MYNDSLLFIYRYFGAFKPNILTRFWIAFEAFEVKLISQALDGKRSTSDVTPSVFYHTLSKALSFKQPEVLKFLSFKPFDGPIHDWPRNPPPPGIILLSVHEDIEIRAWALSKLKEADRNSQRMLNENHRVIMQVLLAKLTSDSTGTSALAQEVLSFFPFSSSLYDFWAALAHVVPAITSQEILSMSLPRLVIGHLHDNDDREFSPSLVMVNKGSIA